MSAPKGEVGGKLARYAASLRFPRLLALTALVFAVDLVVPDAIPFADEILFGLVTALLATMRKRKGRGGAPSDKEKSRP